MLLLHSLLKGKSGSFLKWHIGAVVVFAAFYKGFDEFMSRFPATSKHIGLGETHPPADSLIYWLWFSLVTQTTVGYSGSQTTTGTNIPFAKITNHAYKAINIVQLLSIFGITAYLMQ